MRAFLIVAAVSFGFIGGATLVSLFPGSKEPTVYHVADAGAMAVGFLPELEQCEAIALARGYEREVVMPDGSRCDLVSQEHAIEVDWAHKWAESIGQALLYAEWTGKRPKAILLKTRPEDAVFILRGRLAARAAGVDFEVVDALGK